MSQLLTLAGLQLRHLIMRDLWRLASFLAHLIWQSWIQQALGILIRHPFKQSWSCLIFVMSGWHCQPMPLSKDPCLLQLLSPDFRHFPVHQSFLQFCSPLESLKNSQLLHSYHTRAHKTLGGYLLLPAHAQPSVTASPPLLSHIGHWMLPIMGFL